jgi:hypothetical protein
MTSLDSFLNDLAPADTWSPAWDDVLRRAERPAESALGGRGRWTRRHAFVLALATTAAVIFIPLVAVAASNNWWFLKHPIKQSTPVKAPLVVKEGAFGRKRWELVAYPAESGLCWSLTFAATEASGGGSGAACAPVVGFPSQYPNAQMTITYLASEGSPGWIVGPVVSTASTVRIRFASQTITTPTFPAPSSLGRIRFYAIEVPRLAVPHLLRPRPPLRWLAGYDSQGRIVACLDPMTARDGVSALTACRE